MIAASFRSVYDPGSGIVLAGIVATAACKSPSSPSVPYPEMRGEWRGSFLAEYPPPVPGFPTSIACNINWSITRQDDGRFSGEYQSIPGQQTLFPLGNCIRAGAVSGGVSTRGVVSDLKFDPPFGVSNECVPVTAAALGGQMNDDRFTALGTDRMRCDYSDGPITTPRTLRVDIGKVK